MEITTIGLDIAKRVFQLHGVDGAGIWGRRRGQAATANSRDARINRGH